MQQSGACPSLSGKLAGGSSILCRQALLVNVPIERGGENPKVAVAHQSPEVLLSGKEPGSNPSQDH